MSMQRNARRVILAGAIGNVLEWYDFGLYGLLAPVLAALFFPGHSRTASLLEVYGGFAAGFAMRPIGAAVLGQLADRLGRRFMLALSIVLMGIATVAVGLLPTYHSSGFWAPILLITVRLFQGFSVGGEFVGSVTYLVETGQSKRRGVMGSVANLGSTGGMLLAAGVAAAVTGWADPAQLASWAWRVPFWGGGLLALAAYTLRRHLPENWHESELHAKSKRVPPLWEALRDAPGTMAAIILFTSGYGIVNYLTMVFLPTYAREFGSIPEHQVLRINTAGQALALLIVPLAGWFSDRVMRRRTILSIAFVAEAAVSWKGFSLARHGGASGLWVAQLGLAALLAIVMGSAPAMLAEQFRADYRVSGHAVAFNIGIGMAGGTAPMIAMGLIRMMSSVMAPAAYLIFAAMLSALSVLTLTDRSREPLD
jgi:MFS transporter, MHS family, proline/betaine transporter